MRPRGRRWEDCGRASASDHDSTDLIKQRRRKCFCVLTGWIGSAKQIEGAQELAKNLISESIRSFEALRGVERIAEAQSDLAVCYWREGAFDDARVLLYEALG